MALIMASFFIFPKEIAKNRAKSGTEGNKYLIINTGRMIMEAATPMTSVPSGTSRQYIPTLNSFL